MKIKSFTVIGVLFVLILCVGCNSKKSLECKLEDGNTTYTMKWNPKHTTSITETTYNTEEEAISSEKYYKENMTEYEVSRNGKKVVTKLTKKSNDTYDEGKEILEKMGYTCK